MAYERHSRLSKRGTPCYISFMAQAASLKKAQGGIVGMADVNSEVERRLRRLAQGLAALLFILDPDYSFAASSLANSDLNIEEITRRAAVLDSALGSTSKIPRSSS